MDKISIFPYEIKDLESEMSKELMNVFTGELTGYVRVGPKGYLYPHAYKRDASDFYNMSLRPDDIFVASYPRSGTTLTQELVWLIKNDLDYERSYGTDLDKRYCFMDIRIFYHPKIIETLKSNIQDNKEKLKILEADIQSGTVKLANMSSPRFIKTHFPLSLLPPNLLDTTKMVYVARDPRDVVVSAYHQNRLLRIQGYTGDFKTYWKYFIEDLVQRAPYFEHIKEAWDKRHHPNMLFLFYEELITNMPSCIRRVAKFLDKKLTDDQVNTLSDHLRFDNFKKNMTVNSKRVPELSNQGEEPFIRKGKAGGWRDCFDAEMIQLTEEWIADNLRDTDLRFPSMNC